MKMFTTIGYLILGSLALLPLRANQGDLPTKEIRLNLVSLAQDDGSNVSVTENQFRSYIDALNEYNNHASNKGFLFYGIELVVQSFQIHNSSALYNSATAGPVNNTIRSLYSKPRELTIWTNNKWYNAQGLHFGNGMIWITRQELRDPNTLAYRRTGAHEIGHALGLAHGGTGSYMQGGNQFLASQLNTMMTSTYMHDKPAPAPIPAPNDDFADAITIDITELPVWVGGRTHDCALPLGPGASLEPGEPEHPSGPNQGSVWWSFTAAESGRLKLYTRASSFDALVAVYTGNAVDELSLVAVDEVGFFPPSTVLFLDAVAGTTYHVAISGKDRGGEPLEGLDFGSTSLVISAPEPPLFTALETLLPQGSDWHYLLLTQGNGDDPPLMNEPIDPRDIDPDFDQTWHTEEGYDGPAFLGPSPALLGYGVVNATQVVTDIWGGRDADGDPSTNDTAPPSGLRHAAYFRTTFTPASNVQHLGFRGIIDDGAEIFVNGERVLNINYWGPEGAWDGAAGPSNGTEDELQESVAIGVNLQAGLVVELAVAVHNSLATSSDMGFDLEVYSIADPGSDVGKKLITGEPLVARFDSATAGAMSGLGDGGIDDSLPWLSSSATVEAESTLPNPPTGGSAGKVLYASMKAVGFVSGAIDLRGVDNSQVVATVDFRTFESSSTSDFEAADWIEAYVEASLDTITYYRVADLIPLRSGSNQESPDELKPLELPGAAFNTFHTTPGDIPAAARSLRIVVSGELKGSVSEHFFIDNVSVGTDLASPPPVRASISRDPSTGANTITWNSDGASTYRVFFGTDLAGLTQIHSGSGNDSFTHTPPAIDPQGFYFVLRSSSAPAPD